MLHFLPLCFLIQDQSKFILLLNMFNGVNLCTAFTGKKIIWMMNTKMSKIFYVVINRKQGEKKCWSLFQSHQSLLQVFTRRILVWYCERYDLWTLQSKCSLSFVINVLFCVNENRQKKEKSRLVVEQWQKKKKKFLL